MTVLDALTLPEEHERRLNKRQRGYYLAVQTMAAAAITTFKAKRAPRKWTDETLTLCRAMLDEIGNVAESKP